MSRLLEGKVAVVTGAGTGIGRATALLFAAHGAKVVVNDTGVARDGTGGDPDVARRVVQEISDAGGTAVANTDTVASQEGATAIVETAVNSFGSLDALVNNAGIVRDRTIGKLDLDAFESVVRVQLEGTFLCSQAAARQMRSQGGGRIVNTTSVAGLLGNFGQANSSAANAAVYGLTRTLSIELQKDRITVNAVAPVAKTRMTEDLPMFEQVETMTPAHVASGHLFFASDLSGELSGNVLSIAGGKLGVYKVVESAGKFKESNDGVWEAEEIAEYWEIISKV